MLFCDGDAVVSLGAAPREGEKTWWEAHCWMIRTAPAEDAISGRQCMHSTVGVFQLGHNAPGDNGVASGGCRLPSSRGPLIHAAFSPSDSPKWLVHSVPEGARWLVMVWGKEEKKRDLTAPPTPFKREKKSTSTRWVDERGRTGGGTNPGAFSRRCAGVELPRQGIGWGFRRDPGPNTTSGEEREVPSLRHSELCCTV